MTYYIDAVAGSDTNDGRSPTTAWKTIAKVNAFSFSPGDSILFNKGNTWTDMLIPPSSGAAGNPITFGAYGSGQNPIISGINSLRALSLTAHSYLTFQNLHFTKATQDNIAIFSTSGTPVVTNIIFDHVLSDYAAQHGMFDYSPSPGAHNNVTISYSEFAYNNASGIEKNGIGDSWLIDHSSFHDNCLSNAVGFKGGLRFISSSPTDRATNATIQYSIAYNNGTDVAGITTGTGLWFDTVGAGCKMLYNLSYNNHDAGILVEASSGALIQGNSVWGNADGIRFYNHVQNSKMCDNIAYANRNANIVLLGLFGGGDPGGFSGNVVKNNVSLGVGKSLWTDFGANNDGTNGSGNVYTFNAFGIEAQNFIQWGATAISTYAAFDTAYGSATNSVTIDPLYIAMGLNGLVSLAK